MGKQNTESKYNLLLGYKLAPGVSSDLKEKNFYFASGGLKLYTLKKKKL